MKLIECGCCWCLQRGVGKYVLLLGGDEVWGPSVFAKIPAVSGGTDVGNDGAFGVDG